MAHPAEVSVAPGAPAHRGPVGAAPTEGDRAPAASQVSDPVRATAPSRDSAPGAAASTGRVVRAASRSAREIVVEGVVQGVGFRPFVWRLATELGVSGRVRNVAGRVEIDAVADVDVLAVFERRLRTDAPPHARVERVAAYPPGPAHALAPADGGAEPPRRPTSAPALDLTPVPPPTPAPGRAEASVFVIEESDPDGGSERLFPPDLATCDDCLAEVRDPADRRYRYPFTNCTSCGPRATIIEDLPYDRASTTMRAFPMCPTCAAEYRDPANRRFHAEPVACPECGPRLAYRRAERSAPDPLLRGDAALEAALADLLAGRVVAVKGLGGYHLACDATNDDAVRRLRDRKRRWAKPFAVMAADLAAAERLAQVGPAEVDLLTGPARPIVLLDARPYATSGLAPSVTAGNPRVGVFLPYSPLHQLLVEGLGRTVVLTSGNVSDEPLATDDADAAHRLGPLADAFLTHDRVIRARYDDSVTRVVGGRESIVRRGRGYAPEPLPLPVPTPRPLLAVGAELKHTFTLARESRAHVAPHNGDLEDLSTHTAFTDGLAHLSRLLELEPDVVAHDLHPEYLSTKYALAHFPVERRVAVQHHHAHVASCAAENGVAGPFLGVAYDGLGRGDDGTFWGGEVLLADLAGYRRVARFARAPMPGGALAVRRPYRMALGYLLGAEPLASNAGLSSSPGPSSRTTPRSTWSGGWIESGAGMPPGPPGLDPDLVEAFAARLDPREVDVVRTQVRRGLNAPLASSAGRLFDAVSALLGLRDVAESEAQAAIDLETAADTTAAEPLPYALDRVGGLLVYDPRPTLTAVLDGAVSGRPTGVLAAAFHESVAEVTRELLGEVRAQAPTRAVCLSGGVLQNRRLVTTLVDRLTGDGFEVHVNHLVPCNDGGISYGQAAVAAARMAAAGPGESRGLESLPGAPGPRA